MGALTSCVQPFLAWVIQTTLVAGILTCLILAVQRLFGGRLGPRSCHALWLILLIRMVLPWAPPSAVSLFNLIPARIQPTWPPGDGMVAPGTDKPEPVRTPDVPAAESASSSPAGESADGPRIQDADPSGGGRLGSQSAGLIVRRVLPILWLAGAMVFGGYLFASSFALWRIIKREHPLTNQPILELFEECKSQMGVETIVALVPNERASSAALFGFVRPRLLLPRRMIETTSREEMRYVFLHELAHLKRRDIYLGWLTSVLQVLHWFNPLVWLAFHRMRADRELACDALVLTRTGQEESREYGRTMLGLLERFSRARRLPAMAGILESRTQLKRRMTMIAEFRSNSYRWSPLAAALMVLLACVSLPGAAQMKASQGAENGQQAVSEGRTQTEPVIRELGIRPFPLGMALSPDGNKLVYLAYDTAGVWTDKLVLRDLTTGDETTINDAATSFPDFSPDGSMIAYTHVSENGTKLVVHIYSLETREDRSLDVAGGVQDWSGDGRRLLLRRERKTNYIVPVDGGEAQELNVDLNEGRFSPDSQYVAYCSNEHVCLYALASGETTEVAEGSSPLWCPDGKTLLFCSQRAYGPEPDLCVISVSDGKPVGNARVIRPDFAGTPISLSRTGRLFYGHMYVELLVCVVDIDPETAQPAGKPTRLAKGSRATWSPNGTHIAYTVDNMLHVMSADGSNDQEIMEVHVALSDNLAWSADNEHVYLRDNRDLCAISISNKSRRLVRNSAGSHLACSPDGKHIAYIGGASSKESEVFMIDTDGENLRQLTPDQDKNRYYPAWSPDGKQIAFHSWAPDGAKVLMAVSVEDQSLHEIFRSTSPEDRFFQATWSPDGKRLIWVTGGKAMTLCTGDIESGEYRRMELDLDGDPIWPDWSPDGKKLLLNILRRVEQSMLMDNFLPEAAQASGR